MLKIIKTVEVESALQEIYLYTAEQWGIAQADTYHNQFTTAFEWLADNFELGRKHPDISEPYSVYAVGRHLIIYRTTLEDLYIIAIFHVSMDIASRFTTILEKYPLH